MTDREGAVNVVEERARELLETSSDSVQGELDKAAGWLEGAQFGDRSPLWGVDVVAGALGSLADAWGRLTLWGRAAGTHELVQSDMAECMDRLVQLRQMLIHNELGAGEITMLQTTLDQMRDIHQTLRGAAG